MANANIQLQDQTLQVQTVPGSSVIKVFLPAIQYSYYNPVTGLFSTTRPGEEFEPLLREPQLQELKQKLNQYDAHRRAEIARIKTSKSGA